MTCETLKGMVHFQIADDTASIEGLFPETIKSIEEDRVLNFFNVNIEFIEGHLKMVKT